MERFQQLRLAIQHAQDHQDLPDFLVRRIEQLLEDEPEGLSQVALAELIQQISDYDTYGQTGYLGMGVNHVILSATLDRIAADVKKT